MTTFSRPYGMNDADLRSFMKDSWPVNSLVHLLVALQVTKMNSYITNRDLMDYLIRVKV